MHIINWAIGNQAAKGLKNVQFSTEKTEVTFQKAGFQRLHI